MYYKVEYGLYVPMCSTGVPAFIQRFWTLKMGGETLR